MATENQLAKVYEWQKRRPNFNENPCQWACFRQSQKFVDFSKSHAIQIIVIIVFIIGIIACYIGVIARFVRYYSWVGSISRLVSYYCQFGLVLLLGGINIIARWNRYYNNYIQLALVLDGLENLLGMQIQYVQETARFTMYIGQIKPVLLLVLMVKSVLYIMYNNLSIVLLIRIIIPWLKYYCLFDILLLIPTIIACSKILLLVPTIIAFPNYYCLFEILLLVRDIIASFL